MSKLSQNFASKIIQYNVAENTTTRQLGESSVFAFLNIYSVLTLEQSRGSIDSHEQLVGFTSCDHV